MLVYPHLFQRGDIVALNCNQSIKIVSKYAHATPNKQGIYGRFVGNDGSLGRTLLFSLDKDRPYTVTD